MIVQVTAMTLQVAIDHKAAHVDLVLLNEAVDPRFLAELPIYSKGHARNKQRLN